MATPAFQLWFGWEGERQAGAEYSGLHAFISPPTFRLSCSRSYKPRSVAQPALNALKMEPRRLPARGPDDLGVGSTWSKINNAPANGSSTTFRGPNESDEPRVRMGVGCLVDGLRVRVFIRRDRIALYRRLPFCNSAVAAACRRASSSSATVGMDSRKHYHNRFFN